MSRKRERIIGILGGGILASCLVGCGHEAVNAPRPTSIVTSIGEKSETAAPEKTVASAPQTEPAAQGAPAGNSVWGPVREFDAFSIRPPAEFTEVIREGNGGDRTFTWQGPQRADGTLPTLSVVISDPRAEGSEAYKVLQMADKVRVSSEWVLNMTLSLYGKSMKFERTKTEKVELDGQPFVRAYFTTPVVEKSDVMARGVLYTISHPERVVGIWAADAQPYDKDFLAIAERSIRTFHEKPQAEQKNAR